MDCSGTYGGSLPVAAFVFGHVYLTATGHTLFTHIKAMVTGWEEVEKH